MELIRGELELKHRREKFQSKMEEKSRHDWTPENISKGVEHIIKDEVMEKVKDLSSPLYIARGPVEGAIEILQSPSKIVYGLPFVATGMKINDYANDGIHLQPVDRQMMAYKNIFKSGLNDGMCFMGARHFRSIGKRLEMHVPARPIPNELLKYLKLPEDPFKYAMHPESEILTIDSPDGLHNFTRNVPGVVRIVPALPHTHPKAFGNGQPMTGSGTIAKEGRQITKLDNESGTFKHGPETLESVKKSLEQLGFEVPEHVIDRRVYKEK